MEVVGRKHPDCYHLILLALLKGSTPHVTMHNGVNGQYEGGLFRLAVSSDTVHIEMCSAVWGGVPS